MLNQSHRFSKSLSWKFPLSESLS